MKKTFSMAMMLDRLAKEGRMAEVTPDALDMMKKLDGRVGDDYNWQSVVNGLPLVLITAGDGLDDDAFVNVNDCY